MRKKLMLIKIVLTLRMAMRTYAVLATMSRRCSLLG